MAASPQRADVLWAVLCAPGATGFELCSAVSDATGRRCSPGQLLPLLLRLEDAGLVEVARRAEPFRYALTSRGAAVAHEQGPGRAEHSLLVMVDLVGFTRFTEAHGDSAAHEQASRLVRTARAAAAGCGGTVVKSLGDGVLLLAPPEAAPVVLVRDVAGPLGQGQPAWRVHAGAHLGTPIRHAGDVFGRDVNLVARLCAKAGPGELVLSADDGEEALQVDGFERPVPVRRVPL